MPSFNDKAKLLDSKFDSLVSQITNSADLISRFTISTTEMPALFNKEIMSKSATSTGLSWEAEVILGLSKFISERAEAELTTWFLDNMLEKLCSEHESIYFPQACLMNKNFSSANIPSRIALVDALRNDLERLPPTILCKIHEVSNKDQARLYYYLAYVLDQTRKGSPAANVVGGLAENESILAACRADNQSQLCSLYEAGLFMQAYLNSTQAAEIDWRQFILNTYTKIVKDNVYKEQTRKKYFARIAGYELKYKQALVAANGIVDDITAQIKKISELKDDQVDLKRTLLLQISRHVVEIVSIQLKLYQLAETLDATYLDVALDTTAKIAAGMYSEALTDIADLLQQRRLRACEAMKQKYNLAGDCGAIKCVKKFCDKKEECESLLKATAGEYVLQYLPGIAELAAAKSKDEVKTVLGTVASPVGAWKVKKDTSLISFGALVGGQVSREKVSGEQKQGFVTGLFAPVGLDMTFKTWDGGVFLSALDLGNLLSARFSNTETVESKSNVGIEQVISPGIYLHKNSSSSPFVWGIGYSRTPKLRTVELENGEKQERASNRIIVFVSIDVTIFPLLRW
ncbi:MAG: hypothetical protein A2078_10980 [Nitrospirae bacterium GWC2_57_9]|nr:MAG: hypothetical protein A2078_10980 [Nitrospirae bacterium GWC2_57_9]